MPPCGGRLPHHAVDLSPAPRVPPSPGPLLASSLPPARPCSGPLGCCIGTPPHHLAARLGTMPASEDHQRSVAAGGTSGPQRTTAMARQVSDGSGDRYCGDRQPGPSCARTRLGGDSAESPPSRFNSRTALSAGRGAVRPDPEDLAVGGEAASRTGCTGRCGRPVCTAAAAADQGAVATDTADTTGCGRSEGSTGATGGGDRRTEEGTGSGVERADADVEHRDRRATGTATGTATAATGATAAATAATAGLTARLVATVATVATIATATASGAVAAGTAGRRGDRRRVEVDAGAVGVDAERAAAGRPGDCASSTAVAAGAAATTAAAGCAGGLAATTAAAAAAGLTVGAEGAVGRRPQIIGVGGVAACSTRCTRSTSATGAAATCFTATTEQRATAAATATTTGRTCAVAATARRRRCSYRHDRRYHRRRWRTRHHRRRYRGCSGRSRCRRCRRAAAAGLTGSTSRGAGTVRCRAELSPRTASR